MYKHLLLVFASGILPAFAASSKNLAEGGLNQDVKCKAGKDNIFHVQWISFAPQLLGGYGFEECLDLGPNPVLELEYGVAYTFWQSDISNWMHPIGFAYYPDGAHGYERRGIAGAGTLNDGSPELEYPVPDACDDEEFMCNPGVKRQAPLYIIDGEAQTWDNWSGPDGGYEDLFYYPQAEWITHSYGVRLTIPKGSLTKKFFYFCHVHQGMSGLITVKDPPRKANELVYQFVPKAYYPEWSKFDQNCGTSGLEHYKPNAKTGSNLKHCPGQEFMCKDDDSEFAKCMYALDCKMNYMMRSEYTTNPLVVFMHQMIPHHVNAVNMARAASKHLVDEPGNNPTDPAVNDPPRILNLNLQPYPGHSKSGKVTGRHLSAEVDDDAEGVLDVQSLLRDIMNTQNHQIQQMKEWLERYGSPAEYCDPPEVTARRFLR